MMVANVDVGGWSAVVGVVMVLILVDAVSGSCWRHSGGQEMKIWWRRRR
jgi:hypothetical protein